LNDDKILFKTKITVHKITSKKGKDFGVIRLQRFELADFAGKQVEVIVRELGFNEQKSKLCDKKIVGDVMYSFEGGNDA